MYATVEDLIAQYSEDEIKQLSDRSGNDAIDEDVVVAAIASAEAEVNDYLRGRIEVPFPDGAVPPTIQRATVKIARFHLHRDPTEGARQDYKDAIATLKDIQAGKMVLEVGNNNPAPGSGLPQIKSNPPGITDKELASYGSPHGYGG